MITKKVAMNNAKKSSFSNLVKYCVDEQNKLDRVETVRVTNCQSDNLEWALMEIEAIQAQNTRAVSDKTYHLIISFRQNETLEFASDVESITYTPEQASTIGAFSEDALGEHDLIEPKSPLTLALLAQIENEMCEALGFSEHQRISVVHNDTDNLHIHVAINKIHPTKLTLHEPYRDYKTRDEKCAELEKKYGLEVDNHKARRTTSQAKAKDMENHSGIESLISYAQGQIPGFISHCKNWEDFHQHLQGVGLKIKPKGAGFVFTTHDDVIGIKASSVSADYSRKRLEERFGDFAAQQVSGEKRVNKNGQEASIQYKQKPVYKSKVNTTDELFSRYKEYQTFNRGHRSTEANSLERARKEEIRQLRRNAMAKRQVLRLSDNNVLRTTTKDYIAHQLALDIKEVNEKYIKKRVGITEKYSMDSWAKWLIKQAEMGDSSANKKLPRAKKKHEQEQKYNIEKQVYVEKQKIELGRLQLAMSKEIESLQGSANLKLKVLQLAGRSVLHRLAMRSIQKQLMSDVKKVSRKYVEKKKNVYQSNRFMTFQGWLRAEAANKNADAVAILRGRTKKSRSELMAGKTAISPAVSDAFNKPDSLVPGAKVSHVTTSGTTVYMVAKTPIRDTGAEITINNNRLTKNGIEAALRMAVFKYGKAVEIHGPVSAQKIAVQVAIEKKLDLTFKNPRLEVLRQAHIKKQINQEIKANEYRESVNRRRDSSSDGSSGRTERSGLRNGTGYGRGNRAAAKSASKRAAGYYQSGARAAQHRQSSINATTQANMPNVPPRTLAKANYESAGILSADVRDRMANEASKVSGGLRRDLHRTEGGIIQAQAPATYAPPNRKYYSPSSLAEVKSLEPVRGELSAPVVSRPGMEQAVSTKPKDAAAVYIESRNHLRQKVFDIPYHRRYTEADSGAHEFAGTRKLVDKQLALLKIRQEIVVAIVDAKTAIRLNRLPLGTTVTIEPSGKIITQSKGKKM